MRYAFFLRGLVKSFLKKTLYGKTTFTLLNIPTLTFYWAAEKLSSNYFGGSFLLFAKLQIAVGYRSGAFSFAPNGKSLPKKRQLQQIERRLLKALDWFQTGGHGTKRVNGLLFATSFVAPTGGHTRLLQTYLKHIPEAKLLISGDAFFLRRQQFLADQKVIAGKLFRNAADRITMNRSSKMLPSKQIDLLYQHLSTLRPRKIVLFNEPSDLALLMAALLYAKSNKNVSTHFYHHADDFLALLGSAFDQHIDVDHNQQEKCRDVPHRHLVRISVPKRTSEMTTQDQPFTVFSFVPAKKVGADGKGEHTFLGLISLLSREGIRCILATRQGEGHRISTLLTGENAVFSKITIDEDCHDISKYSGSVQAYLDTFPIGGGMSVVDALSMGLPVAINAEGGNQVFKDPVLRNFSFNGANEILQFTKNLRDDPAFRKEISDDASRIFRENYGETEMIDNFVSVISVVSRVW